MHRGLAKGREIGRGRGRGRERGGKYFDETCWLCDGVFDDDDVDGDGDCGGSGVKHAGLWMGFGWRLRLGGRWCDAGREVVVLTRVSACRKQIDDDFGVLERVGGGVY